MFYTSSLSMGNFPENEGTNWEKFSVEQDPEALGRLKILTGRRICVQIPLPHPMSGKYPEKLISSVYFLRQGSARSSIPGGLWWCLGGSPCPAAWGCGTRAVWPPQPSLRWHLQTGVGGRCCSMTHLVINVLCAFTRGTALWQSAVKSRSCSETTITTIEKSREISGTHGKKCSKPVFAWFPTKTH